MADTNLSTDNTKIVPSLVRKKSKIEELKQNFEKNEIQSPRSSVRVRRKKLEEKLEEKEALILELQVLNEELQKENKKLLQRAEKITENNNNKEVTENSNESKKKTKKKQRDSIDDESTQSIEELEQELETLLDIGETLKEKLSQERQQHAETKKIIQEQNNLISQLKFLLSSNDIPIPEFNQSSLEKTNNSLEPKSKVKKTYSPNSLQKGVLINNIIEDPTKIKKKSQSSNNTIDIVSDSSSDK